MDRLEELRREAERLLALNKAGNPARSSDRAVIKDAFARGDAAVEALEAIRDFPTLQEMATTGSLSKEGLQWLGVLRQRIADGNLPTHEPARSIRMAELLVEMLQWRGISGPKNVGVRMRK